MLIDLEIIGNYMEIIFGSRYLSVFSTDAGKYGPGKLRIRVHFMQSYVSTDIHKSETRPRYVLEKMPYLSKQTEIK